MQSGGCGERKPAGGQGEDRKDDSADQTTSNANAADSSEGIATESKKALKSPSKSGRGKHGQDDSDEEGEVKDASTPIGNRDLRQDIGEEKNDSMYHNTNTNTNYMCS